MNKRLLTLLFTFLPGLLFAQKAYTFKIPTDRMLFHDLVDKQQRLLLNENDSLQLSGDESINLQVADVLIRQVDEMQQKIEMDSSLNGQMKVKALKSIETLLNRYNRSRGSKDCPVSIAPALFMAFKEAMQLDRTGQSIEPVVGKYEYGVGKQE
jgi:hypothetical protein